MPMSPVAGCHPWKGSGQCSVASLGCPSGRSLSSGTISLCNISLQCFLGGVGTRQVMSCTSNKWVLGLPNLPASSQGSSACSNSQRWAGDSHVTYWGITWNFNRPLTGLLWVPQLIQTRSLLQGLIPPSLKGSPSEKLFCLQAVLPRKRKKGVDRKKRKRGKLKEKSYLKRKKWC